MVTMKVGPTTGASSRPGVVAATAVIEQSPEQARSAQFEGLSSAARRAQRGLVKTPPMRAEQRGAPPVLALGAATPALLPAVILSPADRARQTFSNFDLTAPGHGNGAPVDVHRDGVLETLPAAVRSSYLHYYTHGELNDWATVSVSKQPLGSKSVWMVATRTDGSDNYMELFSEDGVPLASGKAMDDEPRVWDRSFGAVRDAVVYD